YAMGIADAESYSQANAACASAAQKYHVTHADAREMPTSTSVRTPEPTHSSVPRPIQAPSQWLRCAVLLPLGDSAYIVGDLADDAYANVALNRCEDIANGAAGVALDINGHVVAQAVIRCKVNWLSADESEFIYAIGTNSA